MTLNGCALASGLVTSITTDRAAIGVSDTVTWSIRVSNQSALTATGVALDVTLPSKMTNNNSFSSYWVDRDYFNPTYTSPTADSLRGGTVASYSIGSLAPGANRLFQISVKAGYAPADGGIFVMSARANSNNGVAPSETQAAVTYSGSDSSFILSGESVKIIPGVPFTLKAHYGHNGSAPLMNPKVSLELPPETVVVAGTAAYQVAGTTVSWSPGTLVRGDTGQRQITLVYSGTAPAGTLESATGGLSADSMEARSSSWPLTVEAAAGLKTVISTQVSQAGVSDTVVWSIRVSNQSALTATGVALDVTLPPNMTNNNSFSEYAVDRTYFNPPYTSPDWSILRSGTTASYSIGSLAPGANRFFQISLKAGYGPVDGGIFVMTARAGSNNGVAPAETQAAVSYSNTVSYSPTIEAIPEQNVNENGNINVNGLTVADLDTPVSALTLSAASTDQRLIPSGNILVSGSGSNRSISITPAANQSGSCYLTITVYDGKSIGESKFKVNVLPVNSPPTISTVPDVQITENTSTASISFNVDDPDNNAATITVTAATSNPSLIPVSGINLGGTGTARSMILTPAKDQKGFAVITLSVNDGQVTTSSTFTLTVISGGVNGGIVVWRKNYFGAAFEFPAIAGDSADPDGDGVGNLIEYACGTSPINPLDAPRFPGSITENRLLMLLNRNINAIDVTLHIEAADSLAGPWISIASSANGAAFTAAAPGGIVRETGSGAIRIASISDVYPISQKSRRFMRMRVTR